MSKSKYHNIPVVVDGRRFASKREARAYGVLKALEKAGKVADLKCQVPFHLTVQGMLVAVYYADFTYYDEDREFVVADAKGVRTALYKLKKKLMKAIYGIEILEL